MDLILLRLLLALSVAVAHFSALTGAKLTIGGISALVAVQAFFVVSGWIVTSSYKSSNSTLAFYIRRLARLYPLYAVVVILQGAWIAIPLLDRPDLGPELARYLASNLTFANFLKPSLLGFLDQARVGAINPSLWTLKIEVLFYLSIPLWVAISRRYGWAGLVGLYFASAAFAILAEPYSQELAKQLPGQLRFFVAGMACQWILKQRWLARIPRPVIAGIALVAFILAQTFDSVRAAIVFQPLFVSVLVIASTCLLPRIRRLPDISFGVYLIHAPLIQFALQKGWLSLSDTGLVAVLAVTAFLALVAHYLVEKPAMRLGRRWSDRFENSRSRVPHKALVVNT